MTAISVTMSWAIALLIGLGAAVFSYFVVRSEGETSIRAHDHKPHRLVH